MTRNFSWANFPPSATDLRRSDSVQQRSTLWLVETPSGFTSPDVGPSPQFQTIPITGVINLNLSLKTWLGQVTTGHGFMILGSTLLAVLSGTMALPVAFPLFIAGVIGLAWPENTAFSAAAQTAATDIETAISAYKAGLAGTAAKTSVPLVPGPMTKGIAALALVGLSFAACANQTPAQTAADVQAVESGVKCLTAATGDIAATSTTPGSGASKAVQSAEAVGNELITDPACAAALEGAMPPATP